MCSNCHAPSHVPAPQSHGPLYGALFIVLFSGLIAGVLHSTAAFVGGCMLALIFYVVRWRRLALVLLLPSELERQKKRWTAYSIIEIVGMIFSWQ
jgi:hypothetical protein